MLCKQSSKRMKPKQFWRLMPPTDGFNCLNRQSALHNIRILCPSFFTVLCKTYRRNAKLFIDGEYVLSQEGTTQGDPPAMGMYAQGILPLIKQLDDLVKQVWFADDASAGNKLAQLREWWDKLLSFGLRFGYYVNPDKTWLIVKPHHFHTATDLFKETGVKITT